MDHVAKKRSRPAQLRISSEAVYLLAIPIIAFAVAMLAAADFGVSMVVAPAYILSQKLSFLTFGQSEYVVQSLLLIAFCILMGRPRPIYLFAYCTCLIYGAVLDLVRLIPIFDPAVCPPGSMAMPLRLLFFTAGTLLTALSVAMFFRTYLYPQMYDFFVKGVSFHYGIDRTKFKLIFDISCLAAAVALTLLFFGRFVGVGVGTILMTFINGPLIGAIGRLLDKRLEIAPRFVKAARRFELN